MAYLEQEGKRIAHKNTSLQVKINSSKESIGNGLLIACPPKPGCQVLCVKTLQENIVALYETSYH